MKSLFKTIMITAAVGLALASCDVVKEFDTYIPTHSLTELVKSATATIGDETVEGVIDNENHTVTFVFNDASDFTATELKFNFPARAILKDGAIEEIVADLSGGKTYTMVINNLDDDVTYTVTAYRAAVLKVDSSECSVIKGLENDADPAEMETAASNNGYGTGAAYLFDGKWVTRKEGYTDVHYQCFGWAMDSLTGSNGEKYGNAYTVDLGSPMRVAKMRFMPYRAYHHNCAAQFEIYAWTLSGEPSGDWANWQLIATVDDSAKWATYKEIPTGESHEFFTEGTNVDFVYAEVPLARYYRIKILKNFYEYYEAAMDANWSARKNYYDVSELIVWKYNVDSEN